MTSTRDRILAATRALLAAGHRDPSIRRVTEAIGINVAAVSYHFGNKAGLLKEAGSPRLTVRQVAEAIAEDLFALRGEDPATRLVLVKGNPEKDQGGWCREAVVDRVEALLREKLPQL
jgi:AcrR family transcriptional regulator